MKKIALIALTLLMAAALFANGGSEKTTTAAKAEWSGSFAFGGSTTVEPIMISVNEVMQARYPQVQISYDAPGSSAGVKGAIDGTYSIGAASREITSDEEAAGAYQTHIALDGVAVIVNKSSVGLDNLDVATVAKIFAGEIKNWKEIGGVDGEIVVINRDEASGTRDCFNHTVMKPAKAKFVDSALIVTGNGDMVTKVGATPNAIGYCGFGYITKDPGTKALTVNKVSPSEANVYNQTYPAWRYLNVITKGAPAEGSFEKFYIDYLLSAEGQEIVVNEKFIRLK